MRHKIKSVMISYNFFFSLLFLSTLALLSRFHAPKLLVLNPILHTINQWLPTNGINTRTYF